MSAVPPHKKWTYVTCLRWQLSAKFGSISACVTTRAPDTYMLLLSPKTINSFESTANVLNAADVPLNSWNLFVGFWHREVLTSSDPAVLTDDTLLPAWVGNNDTFFSRFPNTDLKTAIEAAGEINQIGADRARWHPVRRCDLVWGDERHAPPLLHMERGVLFRTTMAAAEDGGGAVAPAAVDVEEKNVGAAVAVEAAKVESLESVNGAAVVGDVSKFADARWVGGTWDLTQFFKDGETDWDVVIDAGDPDGIFASVACSSMWQTLLLI